ncbi:MAG: wax ester/triacylglycerol synthase domain-containing protein [Jatrophihabitantaceae bacterium]
MTVIEQRMLHSDAIAWYMEKDPVLRSTVVAVVMLDRSPDWMRLRDRIDRLTRVVPVLRMSVHTPPLRVGPPRWSLDEKFDLDFHLRRVRVTDSGGLPEVLEYARTAAMAGFDRDRPLWEFTLLEGMADRGAALVVKIHHSMTDGIGGVQLAGMVVDAGPDSPELEPLPQMPNGHSLSGLELALHSLEDDTTEAFSAATKIVRSLPKQAARAIVHPVDWTKRAVRGVISVGRFVAPINRQSSTAFGERRLTRTLATLDVPLAELRAAAKESGGHLNDAYLAAITAGIKRYHDTQGASLPTMHVTVPVSIRSESDCVGSNRITLIRIELPADLADPMQRIREISAIMARWRNEPALHHTQEIAFGLSMLPRPYLGSMLKKVEVVASDVPGILQSVWLAGAQVTGYYPFGPTIGSAMNVTLMSYAGVCNLGINIDTSAIDNPELMLDCLRYGFKEVLAINALDSVAD